MYSVSMRKKDKVERYIDKLMAQYPGCTVVEGTKSRYYNVNGRVLRVSDHIGANSSGSMSIIIPGFAAGGNYILHAHTSGQISIVAYDGVKDIVRSFFFMSSMMHEIVQNNINIEVEKRDKFNSNEEVIKLKKSVKELTRYKEKMSKKAKTVSNSVLGVPKGEFEDKHLQVIEAIIDKMKKDGKISD